MFPQVPVRQWVITFPRRLRYFVHRDPVLLGRVRRCVLRLAVRQGALTPDVAADFARWSHGGGFSLHAAVRIDAEDRAGLERLLRYCARPAFASERLCWDGSYQPVRYSLTRPLPTGQTEITLTPLELLDRLAALIPPPRRHRHHYAGVFAPHASTRSHAPRSPRSRTSIHWARLLARIYELRPLTCPRCHGEMRLVECKRHCLVRDARSVPRAPAADLGQWPVAGTIGAGTVTAVSSAG